MSTLSEPTVVVSAAQVEATSGVLRERFRNGTPPPTRWDDPLFWNVEASRAERCQYLAIGNAINFRFWTRSNSQTVPSTGIIAGRSFQGSMYMWRALRRSVSEGRLSLSADALAHLPERQFNRAFMDDEGSFPLAPGDTQRIANLRDLGARLADRWDGQFKNVIDAAEGSLDCFVELCGEFRAFDDPVRKLTMVNAIMLSGSGLAQFDRDPLPGVDYHLVKQALRQGLVVPCPDLAQKLACNELLDRQESLMLRGAVMEALIEVADRSQVPTTVIDNLYWLNRRICGEDQWSCSVCPFVQACSKRTQYGMPVEMTRYY